MTLAEDATVVEIGCGPGFFSPSIERAVPRGRLVLVDLQIEMLRLAVERVPRALRANADATRLPLADASVDAVFVSAMLGEVPDPDQALAEIRRVLRVGGHATFAETRRDSDFIAPAALESLLAPHRLELVDRHGIRWQYVARFRAT